MKKVMPFILNNVRTSCILNLNSSIRFKVLYQELVEVLGFAKVYKYIYSLIFLYICCCKKILAIFTCFYQNGYIEVKKLKQVLVKIWQCCSRLLLNTGWFYLQSAECSAGRKYIWITRNDSLSAHVLFSRSGQRIER